MLPDRPLVRRRTALAGALGGSPRRSSRPAATPATTSVRATRPRRRPRSPSAAQDPEQTPDRRWSTTCWRRSARRSPCSRRRAGSSSSRPTLAPLLHAHRSHAEVLEARPRRARRPRRDRRRPPPSRRSDRARPARRPASPTPPAGPRAAPSLGCWPRCRRPSPSTWRARSPEAVTRMTHRARRPADDAGGRARRGLRLRRAGRPHLAVGRARAVRDARRRPTRPTARRRDQLIGADRDAGGDARRGRAGVRARRAGSDTTDGRYQRGAGASSGPARRRTPRWWRATAAAAPARGDRAPEDAAVRELPSGELPRYSPEPASTRTAEATPGSLAWAVATAQLRRRGRTGATVSCTACKVARGVRRRPILHSAFLQQVSTLERDPSAQPR